MCVHMYVFHLCVLKSEDNLRESVLSSNHVDPDEQTQVIRLVTSSFMLWAISTAHNNCFIDLVFI